MATGPWESYKAAESPKTATEQTQESAVQGPWSNYAKSVEPTTAPAIGPWSAYAQPERAKPTPYKNRVEALDDAVNLLEEGAPEADVREAFGKAKIFTPGSSPSAPMVAASKPVNPSKLIAQ